MEMKGKAAQKLFILLLLSGMFLLVANEMGATQNVDHYGFEVDVASPEECIACHDGDTALEIAACTVGCMKGKHREHPVYIQYPPPSNASLYNPMTYVESKGITFFNGEITCSSCHDLKKNNKFHLRINNSQSKLCMVCHKM